jgi:hypothetical protein
MSADILQFPQRLDPRFNLAVQRYDLVRQITVKTNECTALIRAVDELDQELPAEFAHLTRKLLNVLAQGYAEFAVLKAEQQERTG